MTFESCSIQESRPCSLPRQHRRGGLVVQGMSGPAPCEQRDAVPITYQTCGIMGGEERFSFPTPVLEVRGSPAPEERCSPSPPLRWRRDALLPHPCASTPETGGGAGPGLIRAGGLSLTLTNCSTQNSGQSISSGQHNRAGPDVVGGREPTLKA